LYRFPDPHPYDGAEPLGGVIGDPADNLYGTAYLGGTNSCGTVYKLDATGYESVLYNFSFDGPVGYYPRAGVTRDAAGNLYGTTTQAPNSGAGTVYKLDTGGQPTVLHTFTGDPDGMEPFAGVTLDQQGNVYGTTNYGGTYGWGAVYRVAPPKTKGGAWRETVLYSLDSGMDMGANPSGPVIFDSSGNIYGTAAFGGDLNCQGGHGCGTLFELTPPTAENAAWTSTTLYNFQGGSDGVLPEGYMVFDRQGNLYSTTYLGGTGQGGTAFRLNPSALQGRSWTETLLHWFPENKKDGYDPVEGLTWGKWGDLYGVAWVGGDPSCSQDGCGTVFEIWP